MAEYRLLQHRKFDESLHHLSPSTQRKVVWAQVLLGTRGRTPNVKGTLGSNARWRRTPVQGNHYYMWWIPQSESALPRSMANGTPQDDTRTILLHSIRHHDLTDQPITVGVPSDYEPVDVGGLEPRFEINWK